MKQLHLVLMIINNLEVQVQLLNCQAQLKINSQRNCQAPGPSGQSQRPDVSLFDVIISDYYHLRGLTFQISKKGPELTL